MSKNFFMSTNSDLLKDTLTWWDFILSLVYTSSGMYSLKSALKRKPNSFYGLLKNSFMMIFWFSFRTLSSHFIKVENNLKYFVVSSSSKFKYFASSKKHFISIFIFSWSIVASIDTGLFWRIQTKHSWMNGWLILLECSRNKSTHLEMYILLDSLLTAIFWIRWYVSSNIF